jgi:phenylalanine-4-hydroxylase
VEFGLMETPQGLRIYGAGIVSSRTETAFSLEDASPHRVAFELIRVMRTPYRIDDFQPTYFVIPSLEDLLEASLQDFAPIYRQLESLDDIRIGQLATEDAVIHRGDQTYHRSRPAAQ